MRVIIAPQGFKGTLTGPEAALAMAEGLARVDPNAEATLIPMADGGDGTLDALLAATGGQRHTATVVGPLGMSVDADWGALEDGETAVVEMARASGLVLIPPSQGDPMRATTYGTGQLIAAALDARHRRVLVAVGGSATSDGGAGAAQALGARLLDDGGAEIPLGAEGLLKLAHIDLSQRHPGLVSATVQVANDVSNPLTGPSGAAATYGPQKGARPEDIPLLDAALGNMADVIERDLGARLRDIPGMGAAGGLAAGLVAFADATLVPGAALIADSAGLDAALSGADLAMTGEGCLDWQTVFDKAPVEVVRRAKGFGVPSIAVGGSFGDGAERVLDEGAALIEACFAMSAPLPQSKDSAHRALAYATERAVRRWLALS